MVTLFERASVSCSATTTAGAHHIHAYRLAASRAVDCRAKIVGIADLFTLHFRDHVAFVERFTCGRDFLDACDYDAVADPVIDAVRLTRLRREVLHRHAEAVARRLDV